MTQVIKSESTFTVGKAMTFLLIFFCFQPSVHVLALLVSSLFSEKIIVNIVIFFLGCKFASDQWCLFVSILLILHLFSEPYLISKVSHIHPLHPFFKILWYFIVPFVINYNLIICDFSPISIGYIIFTIDFCFIIVLFHHVFFCHIFSTFSIWQHWESTYISIFTGSSVFVPGHYQCLKFQTPLSLRYLDIILFWATLHSAQEMELLAACWGTSHHIFYFSTFYYWLWYEQLYPLSSD